MSIKQNFENEEMVYHIIKYMKNEKDKKTR